MGEEHALTCKYKNFFRQAQKIFHDHLYSHSTQLLYRQGSPQAINSFLIM
jgi:hypothetical protein